MDVLLFDLICNMLTNSVSRVSRVTNIDEQQIVDDVLT